MELLNTLAKILLLDSMYYENLLDSTDNKDDAANDKHYNDRQYIYIYISISSEQWMNYRQNWHPESRKFSSFS